MPYDNIFDKSTGRHVAWIDNGKVYSVETEEQVGIIRAGNVYSLDGQLVGHVADAFQVQEPGSTTPDAFLTLLKAA